MWNKNISTFIECDHSYEQSSIVLFGAPFDGTTSYRPGARFGCNAIRNESFGIETYSPYQDNDLMDICVFDGGDLEFPFGNTQKVLEQIQEVTKGILSDDKIPFMIGGEHLVTLGAFQAVLKKYPDVVVLHFDAHTDLRDEYIGEKLSHASVIRRIWDLIGDGRIYQFGIRSGEKEEFEFAKKHTTLHKFSLDKLSTEIQNLNGKPIYVTVDLDVLDSSLFSGTGTPEAGGIFFPELINGLMLLKNLNIVGCDVNELAPMFDASGASTAVACKVVRELLLILGGM